MEDIENRIESLKKTIRYHQQKYYVEGINEITDYEYDNLYKELQTLEQQYPEYKTEDSPTNRVAPNVASSLTTQEHFIPMLSIENTYSLKEIEDFVERLSKEIKENTEKKEHTTKQPTSDKALADENKQHSTSDKALAGEKLTTEEEKFIKKLILNILTMSINALDIQKIIESISFNQSTANLAGLKYEKGKFSAYQKRLKNLLTIESIQEIMDQLTKNGQVSSMLADEKILYTSVDLSDEIQKLEKLAKRIDRIEKIFSQSSLAEIIKEKDIKKNGTKIDLFEILVIFFITIQKLEERIEQLEKTIVSLSGRKQAEIKEPKKEPEVIAIEKLEETEKLTENAIQQTYDILQNNVQVANTDTEQLKADEKAIQSTDTEQLKADEKAIQLTDTEQLKADEKAIQLTDTEQLKADEKATQSTDTEQLKADEKATLLTNTEQLKADEKATLLTENAIQQTYDTLQNNAQFANTDTEQLHADEKATLLATAEKTDNKLEFVVEQKIDGIAISLWYYNGQLIKALTRGDGVKGELITTQARTIRSIPLKIQESNMPTILEVRGEVYLTKQMFNEINKKQEERNKPLFANPRNTAAGTLKLLDANIVSERKLQFFAHSLGFCSFLKSQEEIFNQLTLWNIPTIPYKKVSFYEDIDSCLTNWKENFPLSFENFCIKSNNFQYSFKIDNDFLENLLSNTIKDTLFDDLYDKELSFKKNSMHEIMIFDHQWNESSLCQSKKSFIDLKKLYQEKIRQDILSLKPEIQNFIIDSYLDSWENEEQQSNFIKYALQHIESQYIKNCSFVIYPNIKDSKRVYLYYKQGQLEIALDENGVDIYSKVQNLVPNVLQNNIYPLIEITGILTNNMQFFAESVSFLGFSTTYKESLDYFRSWGFPVNYGERLAYNAQDVHNICMEWEEKKDSLPFNIDGMVIKLNDLLFREQLGATAHAPRWVRAYKFSPTIVETTLESVTLQVGKGGTITPVANLAPVFLDGTTVKHATLHNFSYVTKIQQYNSLSKFKESVKQESQQSNQSKVQEKQEVTTSLCIGDTIAIIKAGEIIPKVIGINIKKRPKYAPSIVIPEYCPICHHKLITKKSEVACRCTNPNCQGGLQAKMIYFCSIMEIEELGESIIESLVSSGLVETFSDLYKLSREDLLSLPLIAEKKANLIINSIEKSKSQPLSKVLCALSIPNIGKEWASKIVEKFLNLESLQKASLTEIVQTLQNIKQKSTTKRIKEEISMMLYDNIHTLENYDNENFAEQFKNLDVFNNKELWNQYNQKSGQNFTPEMYMNKLLESFGTWEQLREATKEDFTSIFEEKKRKEGFKARNARERCEVLYNVIHSLEHYDHENFVEQFKNLETFNNIYLWSEYTRKIETRTTSTTYINRILKHFDNWDQLKKASKDKLLRVLEDKILKETQKSNKERAKERSVVLYDKIHALENCDNENFAEQFKNLDIFNNTELWSQQNKRAEKSTIPETYIDRILESFDSWDQLKKVSKEDLLIILEDQSLIAQEIYHFFNSDYGKNIIESLQSMGLQLSSEHIEHKSIQNSFITGKKVIVTGTINGFGREEIQEYLKSLGAFVVTSVSKSIDYIIAGIQPGASKIQKATEFQIPILTEQEFRTKLMNEGIQMPPMYKM